MSTPSEIRAWLVANGYPSLAGKRGRLPAKGIAAYNRAHKATPPASPRPASRSDYLKCSKCPNPAILVYALPGKAGKAFCGTCKLS